jgi:hypothetical protein
MAYNVYLFGGLGISAALDRQTLSNQQILDINRILQGYFDKVVKAHDARRGATRYGSALVQWCAFFPKVLPHELLIYLLPYGTKLVNKGNLEKGLPPAGHDGRTNSNLPGGTGSEVYFHTSDATVIANLMFHEAMHNKLRLDNNHLHPRGGLAAESVGPETKLTTRNINEMAAALSNHQPQWTDGTKILAQEWMRPDSDPAKGLF